MKCFYATCGLNYKNGTATSCPTQSDQLALLRDEYLPSKIYNNDNFKKHRLDLQNDIWPSGCILCKEDEAKDNVKSMRHDLPCNKDFNHDGYSDNSNLQHVEFRFSNACNMACLHCSNVFSSQWEKKLKDYVPDNIDISNNLTQLTKTMHRHIDPLTGKQDNYRINLTNSQVKNIIKDLNTNFPNIWKIDFSGGEVLFQKQFWYAIEALLDHPNHKNFFISIRTNFNVENFDVEKYANILNQFGNATTIISLDAGKNIYPYFRDGDWLMMKSNIEKYNQYKNTKSYIGVTCTTSIYQMMDIENIFESFMELPIDGIDWSPVHTPRYLDPSLIMFDFEKEILEDIEQTEKKIINKECNFKLKANALEKLNEIKYFVTSTKNKKISKYKYYNSFLVYRNKIDDIFCKRFNDYYTKFKIQHNEIVRNDP